MSLIFLDDIYNANYHSIISIDDSLLEYVFYFSFIFHHVLYNPLLFKSFSPVSIPTSLKPLSCRAESPPLGPLPGSRGQTSLWCAANAGKTAAVEALLAAKAEVDAASNDGREPQGGAAGCCWSWRVAVPFFWGERWEKGRKGVEVCLNYLIS